MKYILKIVFSIVLLNLLIISCNKENVEIESNLINYELKSITNDYMNVTETLFTDSDKNYNLIINNSNINLLELKKAKKYSYNWSKILLYEIPYKNTNEILAIFINNGEFYKFIYTLENNYLTLLKNNKTIFSLKYNNKGVLSEITDNGFNNGMINSFPVYQVNSVCDCHGVDSCENHQYDRMENCGQYSYSECLVCGNDVCDQDIRCDLARTWTGPAFVLGLMAACAI